MWRLSLFLLIIGCVAIPREEQIREFCLDPNNECVEAVREGETLRAKDYKTSSTKEEYDSYVDTLLEDYYKEHPWKGREFRLIPTGMDFPKYVQPDRPEVSEESKPPSKPDTPEDPPDKDPPDKDPPDKCDRDRSDHGKGDHSAGKGRGHDRGRGHNGRGHGKGK